MRIPGVRFSRGWKKCTYLDQLVPTGRHNDGVLGVRAEPHAGHPLGVALVGDGVLAVTERVPELDGSVARAGDDLAVVGREGDGEHVVGVADEAAGRHACGELPETERLVPGCREGVGAVGGDNLPAIVSPAARRPPRQPIQRTQSETMWEWPCSDLLG
jgi:hypothetical protein